MKIRIATQQDKPAIGAIIEPIFRAGETYAIDSAISGSEAIDYWLGSDKTTFVAEEDGKILGTYYIRTNQAGGGSHVCNCGYITSAQATGRGVARKMCTHSLEYAKSQGYLAMQFNFVVSSNTRAVELWKSFGFNILGTLPRAFKHPSLGFIDAFVMFRELDL
ncbi:MAG TPA: GNAT family N-acetyltransferase [Methylophilaceae bacterium]|nr:GNAT family N-acetyltransferase [Methylophilaceae bacterium]